MLRTTIVSTGMPGSPYYTVLHWSGGDATAAAGARTAAFEGFTVLEPLIANDLTISFDGTVYEVDEATGQIVNAFSGTGWSIVGDNTAEIAPPATQGLITHKSAQFVAGRRLVGKIFVPGLTEGAWVAGGLPASVTDVLVLAGEAFRDTSAAAELGIYSRTRNVFAPSATIEAPARGAVLRSRRD